MKFENLPKAVYELQKNLNEVKTLLLQLKHSKNQKESDRILSVNEVAQLTGYTQNTIYGYCSRNEIPYYKKGGRSYFFESEIYEWIKGGKIKSNADLDAEVAKYLSNNNHFGNE